MARGKISLIGATTLTEYQKHIEKDSALERRFQKIDVAEPTKEVSNMIITGLRSSFEEFHNLIIDDDAIADAVDLSSRYITDRFLPDKAIDLIDEACSTKSMTYNFDTSEVTDLKEKMQTVQKEMEDLLISQQYQKALKKRKIIETIAIEVEEKKKKRTIPRKDRLHITGSDIQKVIHQISGIPLKNLEKEDMSRLRSLGTVISGNPMLSMLSQVLSRDHQSVYLILIALLDHFYSLVRQALVKLNSSRFLQKSFLLIQRLLSRLI